MTKFVVHDEVTLANCDTLYVVVGDSAGKANASCGWFADTPLGNGDGTEVGVIGTFVPDGPVK